MSVDTAKLLGFFQAEDGFWSDFAENKHDHTQEFSQSNRETSNIRRTLVGNKIVNHSDVDGASTVGAAPTTSSFST